MKYFIHSFMHAFIHDFFLLEIVLNCIYLHVQIGTHVPQKAMQRQRTACVLSPFTMWVLRIKFKLSGLAAGLLPTESSGWPYSGRFLRGTTAFALPAKGCGETSMDPPPEPSLLEEGVSEGVPCDFQHDGAKVDWILVLSIQQMQPFLLNPFFCLFFEIGTHCVALADLELTLLALNLQRTSRLCPLSAGITGILPPNLGFCCCYFLFPFCFIVLEIGFLFVVPAVLELLCRPGWH